MIGATDYRRMMDIFWSKTAKLFMDNKSLSEEITHAEKLFLALDMDEDSRRKTAFDWFIFDSESETLGGKPLNHVLKNASFTEEEKRIFSAFRKNVYSFFEVLAMRTGKEMRVRDILTGKEYQVRDEKFTSSTRKGWCGFWRILPFENDHILSGMGYGWPEQVTGLIKLSYEKIKKFKSIVKLTPLSVCELFFQPKPRETVPPRDKLELILFENGFSESDAEAIITRLKGEAVSKTGDFSPIFSEIMTRIKPGNAFKPREVADVLMNAWNSFINKDEAFVPPGPMERGLICIGLDYVKKKVDSVKIHNNEVPQVKAQEIFEIWLKTPRSELDGMTPEIVILEEREKLGNPHKIVSFRILFNEVPMNKDIEKKAEEIFYNAAQALNEDRPQDAVDLYQSYIEINPTNHVVWHNLGVARIFLGEKEKGITCFKQALALNPDYDMAKASLKRAQGLTAKEIAEMRGKGKVQWMGKDNRLDKAENGIE